MRETVSHLCGKRIGRDADPRRSGRLHRGSAVPRETGDSRDGWGSDGSRVSSTVNHVCVDISRDMVTAFVDGGYEQASVANVAAVPEPGGWFARRTRRPVEPPGLLENPNRIESYVLQNASTIERNLVRLPTFLPGVPCQHRSRV